MAVDEAQERLADLEADMLCLRVILERDALSGGNGTNEGIRCAIDEAEESMKRLLRARDELKKITGVALNSDIYINEIYDAIRCAKRRFSTLRSEALNVIYIAEKRRGNYPCCLICRTFSALFYRFARLSSIINVFLGVFNLGRSMGMFLSNPFLR